MSGLVLKSTSSVLSAGVYAVLSGVKSLVSGVGAVFATIAAAGAAANAVENHRQPAEADLSVLGMDGVRFKKYY